MSNIDLVDINNTLVAMNKKINSINEQISYSNIVTSAHPFLFIIMIILFFVTMEFWTKAANKAIKHFHPRGYLSYWEYVLLGLVSLLFLLWIGKKTGLKIQLLSED